MHADDAAHVLLQMRNRTGGTGDAEGRRRQCDFGALVCPHAPLALIARRTSLLDVGPWPRARLVSRRDKYYGSEGAVRCVMVFSISWGATRISLICYGFSTAARTKAPELRLTQGEEGPGFHVNSISPHRTKHGLVLGKTYGTRSGGQPPP